MKQTTMILIMMTVLTTNLCAAIITVDINYPSIGDYKTLQEAHDAASSGDTIYVYPSLTRYDGIHVSKKLTFIGAGYLYDFSVDGVMPSRVSNMYFDSGSDGSVLKGFEGEKIYVSADDINISNNYCTWIYTTTTNVNGLVIMQNKIIGSYNYAIYIAPQNHALIVNNIIINKYSSSAYCISLSNETSIYIAHNVLYGLKYSIFSSESGNKVYGVVINNIIHQGSIYNCRTIEYHNNMSYTSFSGFLGSGNIGNIDMTTVFVDPNPHNYKLKPDSPALAAGVNGEDLGVYGGNAPYVDHGVGTGLPAIVLLKTPTIIPYGSATMDVSIKATSGNTE
jgi:hypothetical protein